MCNRQYLTVAQAAEVMQLNPATVRAMIRRGDLPVIPGVRHYRIPVWAVSQLAVPGDRTGA